MRVTIEFTTTNAAFEDDHRWEASLIGREVTDKLVTFLEQNDRKFAVTEWTLRDSNGNRIGTITVED